MRHTRAPFTLLIAVVAALAVQSAPAVADAPSKTPVAGSSRSSVAPAN
jgi:hypothetical protein